MLYFRAKLSVGGCHNSRGRVVGRTISIASCFLWYHFAAECRCVRTKVVQALVHLYKEMKLESNVV
jgi:hypothetical protein